MHEKRGIFEGVADGEIMEMRAGTALEETERERNNRFDGRRSWETQSGLAAKVDMH
jgi:hypothetical protein